MFKRSLKIIFIIHLLLLFGLQNATAQCDPMSMADMDMAEMTQNLTENTPPMNMDIDCIDFDNANCLQNAAMSSNSNCLIQQSDLVSSNFSLPDVNQGIFFEIEPSLFFWSNFTINKDTLLNQDEHAVPVHFITNTVKTFPPIYQSTKRIRI